MTIPEILALIAADPNFADQTATRIWDAIVDELVASGLTGQGLIDVAKDFPRNGPSGTYSHF